MQFVSTIPDGTNVIATKWVFALKRNKFNEIIKYKARLVARGDKQIYGLDYDIVYRRRMIGHNSRHLSSC